MPPAGGPAALNGFLYQIRSALPRARSSPRAFRSTRAWARTMARHQSECRPGITEIRRKHRDLLGGPGARARLGDGSNAAALRLFQPHARSCARPITSMGLESALVALPRFESGLS